MLELIPYLNFDGNCREAMTFYQRCLGGELHATSFAEAHIDTAPGAKDRLVHARLSRGGLTLMASDTMPGMPFQQGNNVWLNIACERDDEVDALYAKLVEGGSEVAAPNDAFWNARFAMLTDRFGVRWMLNHDRSQQS